MKENTRYETSELRLLPSYGSSPSASSSATLREVALAAFRHRRLALTSFFGVLAGAVLVVALMPASYQASLKILVRNERVDPAVSPAPNAASPIPTITEEDLNSEVELLKSEDVLRSVALKAGLLPQQSHLPWRPQTEDQRMASAVVALRKALDAGPLPRSNLIEVKFASPNPQLAANVLNTLGDFYIQKHMEVHRTSGQYEFFDREAESYHKAMEEAEAKLTATGSVAPKLARDLTVQKQKEFEATLQQTLSEIAETQHRLQILAQQQTATPARMTTQTRKSDNPALLQNLKSTLLTLQLKRTELLTKFQPNYRPVQETEQQIAETQAAIAAEESAPVREETTDQDPVYLWARSEIAKAKSNLVALQSRAATFRQTIGTYHQHAEDLDKQSIEEQDLARTAKTQEDNYLLYMHKREEARITDALDRRRMLNIAIIESAHVPATPVTPMWIRLAMSIGLALIVSIGLVILAEYFDSTFRTPAEVTRLLAVPVLASLPADSAVGGLARQ
jgi:uncharacterized protein involved in exopolysaccharide biosynthesis